MELHLKSNTDNTELAKAFETGKAAIGQDKYYL